MFSHSGTNIWVLVLRASSVAATNSGTLVIGPAPEVQPAMAPGEITLSWPAGAAPAVVERASVLGPDTHWTPATNVVEVAPGTVNVPVTARVPAEFYRLRQVR